MDADRIDTARRAVALIDLTDLADDHTPDDIDELCRRAAAHHTAAVCVWPEYVARCAGLLAGSGVRVATVVNFPSGDEPVEEVVAATRRALADGADDIDLVLPYRAFRAGDTARAGEMVAAVADVVEPPTILKVILESGELTDAAEIAAAARLAIEHGADFVKTSTGKTPHGASVDAARAMLAEIARTARDEGRTVGIKPSGGIRSLDDAAAYLAAADDVMGAGWADPSTFRFGASGLLDVLLAVIEGGAGDPATTDPSTY